MIKLNIKEISVLLIKIALLFCFTSELSQSHFQTFCANFVVDFNNPWSFQYSKGSDLLIFPFHALMLYIHAPFAWLISFLSIENPSLQSLLFKIPLLLADCSIYFFLKQLFNSQLKRVFWFYWANPIILYTTYMHSQLDIIPTAFLVASLFYMLKKHFYLSAVLFGSALATKFHVLIALPFILLYLFKRHTFSDALKFFCIIFSVLILIDFPFLASTGFWEMVVLNPRQSLLWSSFYKIGEYKLYLPIASILLIYCHFFNQKKVNQDLLFMYLGLLFTSVVLFIVPSPAWYVWLIPFISIFFIQNENYNKSLAVYSSFSVAYLIFFVFFYKSNSVDIIFFNEPLIYKLNGVRIINVSYTVLEAMLLAIMVGFYKYGIKSNSIYKTNTNLTIGIGGDSGSGKTSLLKSLQLLLNNNLLEIEGDGEHKWERGDKKWQTFTHLDPKANNIHKQASAIQELKKGRSIYRSEYDHDTGKFTKPLLVEPRDFIAISGLHPFYLPVQRKNIDFKIYVDTDEQVRRHWKIKRDTAKRGYSHEQIIQQIESRVEDAKKYIHPQKQFADLIISFFPLEKVDFKNEDIGLGLKVVLDANVHLEDVLAEISTAYSWDYNDDLKTQFVEFKSVPDADYKSVAYKIIPNVNEIVSHKADWLSGYNGFIQLIAILMISYKMKKG